VELYACLIQIEENVNKKIQHRSRCIQGLGKRKAKSQRPDDGDQMTDDGSAVCRTVLSRCNLYGGGPVRRSLDEDADLTFFGGHKIIP